MKYIWCAVIIGLCLLGFGCYQSQEIIKSQGLSGYFKRAKEVIRINEGNISITFVNNGYESREALDRKRTEDRNMILNALKKAGIVEQEIVKTMFNLSEYIEKTEGENVEQEKLSEADDSYKNEIIANIENDIAYNNKAISVFENSQLPNKRQIIDTIIDRSIADKINFINFVKNSEAPKVKQTLNINKSSSLAFHKLLQEIDNSDFTKSDNENTLTSLESSNQIRLLKAEDTIIIKTKSIEKMEKAVREIEEAHEKRGLVGGYHQYRALPNFIGIKMEMIEDAVYHAWRKRHPDKPYVSSAYGGTAGMMP